MWPLRHKERLLCNSREQRKLRVIMLDCGLLVDKRNALAKPKPRPARCLAQKRSILLTLGVLGRHRPEFETGPKIWGWQGYA
jgi:hypothetical protein